VEVRRGDRSRRGVRIKKQCLPALSRRAKGQGQPMLYSRYSQQQRFLQFVFAMARVWQLLRLSLSLSRDTSKFDVLSGENMNIRFHALIQFNTKVRMRAWERKDLSFSHPHNFSRKSQIPASDPDSSKSASSVAKSLSTCHSNPTGCSLSIQKAYSE
jgi:hypothetical protein